MLNKVILIGNLGKDPEVKEINGNSLAKFSLGTSESYKNKQREKVTETQWHNCQVWGKLADVVEKYVKKGDKVYIEGKIKTDKYEKNGETKFFVNIVVRELRMLGGQPKTEKPKDEKIEDVQDVEDDSLPF